MSGTELIGTESINNGSIDIESKTDHRRISRLYAMKSEAVVTVLCDRLVVIL